MPLPRSQLVNIKETPYYHVTSRCVRRAYLCGVDNDTGKTYEHRKQWLENRIRILSTLFAVDLCAYAVMSNHYHIVLKLTPAVAKTWTDSEVLKRWRCLFKGTLLVQRYLDDQPLSKIERETLQSTIATYRKNLTDLSWFMRCLNEPIARMANKEDNCTGHFWESRFQSHALKTENALLACMAYVDLNPVRAGIAKTPEHSEYTSIKERVSPSFDLRKAVSSQLKRDSLREFPFEVKPLLGFQENEIPRDNKSIPFSLRAYLELVDWTGRTVRSNKRSSISTSMPPIILRLGYSAESWISQSCNFEKLYRSGVFRRAS